jgi:AraC-like DNA-binding protein
LPIYQIQDFEALARQDQYFYFSPFALHLQEHLFIREPHKHNFYIILIVTQGTGSHTIDFKEFEVKPGTVFFMTPGQVHSWELSKDADGFVIFFTQQFYAREYPHKMLFDFPFFNALLYNPVLSIAKAMREIMLSRYLDILLIELTRIFQPKVAGTGSTVKEQALLQNLERLIDVHYKEHKPVGFYAQRLHVTTKHLNDVCKNSLGKTTKDLIQYRTLLEAQRLLVHANLTSSQIAAELGYFDNTYFFRFFKKHIGCTPEQFRAANR